MKFSVIAATLVSGVAAAPSFLAPRAAPCWTNSIENKTTETSPLVADCRALAESNLSEPWTPSEENNFTFEVHHGTCGFRGVFNPAGGSLPVADNVISSSLVSNAINHAAEYFVVDGKVGADGYFMCLQAGYQTKTGWTKFEIYTVE